MHVYRWLFAGYCLISATLAGAAEARDIYTKGGTNPAAMACVTCHGAEALGAPGFPRLAGLSAAYLMKQLADYASGARANPIMQPVAEALDADELVSVSEMLSQLPRPNVEPLGRATAVEGIGDALALRGAWDRNIPECVACHGRDGLGVGIFPALAGQSAAYLELQLEAWRQGIRKNDPNDLMGHIARSLTDEEIKAVSEFFAGLGQ